MAFTSYQFFLFLPAVVLLYFILPGSWRVSWLLLVSGLFYACFHPLCLAVVLAVTGISWGGGLYLDQRLRVLAEDPEREENMPRRRIGRGFLVCVLVCLLFLIFFKYTDFILKNVNFLTGRLSLTPVSLSFSLIMPVGISYYTFQVVSYLTDIYKGKIRAERNILHYALYVMFFSKATSGPVERADMFLTQIRDCRNWKLWDSERVRDGLVLMMWGYFQKLVIADRLAILTGEVFGHYRSYGSAELLAAAAAFYIQLYTDFNGYTEIARGVAKVTGFTLAENFRAPFFAGSIREYWSRWHISLSSWLRDYIYIPLGGNRKGKLRKYGNLMLTFLVSGIWHGAAWNFVFWGVLHGVYEVAEDMTKPWVDRMNGRLHTRTESFSYRLFRKVKCWLLVCLAYIFFKVPTIGDGFRYLKRIAVRWNPWAFFDGTLYTLGISEKYMHLLGFALLLVLAMDWLQYKKQMRPDAWLAEQCIWFRWLAMLGLVMAVVVFGAYGPAYHAENFIYFGF